LVEGLVKEPRTDILTFVEFTKVPHETVVTRPPRVILVRHPKQLSQPWIKGGGAVLDAVRVVLPESLLKLGAAGLFVSSIFE
jgi:hypothetical protein